MTQPWLCKCPKLWRLLCWNTVSSLYPVTRWVFFFYASLCMSVSVLMHSVPVLRVFRMCYFCSPERLLVCMTWWPFSMIQYIAPQCDGLRLISSFSAAHMRSSSCVFCHEVTVHGWRDIQIQELSALWGVRQVLFAIQLIGVMRDFTERSCWL